MSSHTSIDSSRDGARSENFKPFIDNRTGRLAIQKDPRENPFLQILMEAEVNMDEEVRDLLRDNPQYKWIEHKKDGPPLLSMNTEIDYLVRMLYEDSLRARAKALTASNQQPLRKDWEDVVIRRIFIGLAVARFRENPYMSLLDAHTNREQREQGTRDPYAGGPHLKTVDVTCCSPDPGRHLDFKDYRIPRQPRAESSSTNAQTSQTTRATEPAISDMEASSQIASGDSPRRHTRRPPLHRARSPPVHSPSRKRPRTTTPSTNATQRISRSEYPVNICSMEQIPSHIRRRLAYLEDHSGRAHCQMGNAEKILTISPLLPPPKKNRQWLGEWCLNDIETEMRRIEVADFKPFISELVTLDDARHEEHMQLQHEPLLWELPPMIIAAARRVFVDGSDEASAAEETRIGQNAKARRRMQESQSPHSSVRGLPGTAPATPTWAFVWARRNGLLEELRNDNGYRGYPILPAVVAALVIERAIGGSIGGKGKAWKFLLWRAIWSERIRRQSEHHFVQAHGRLPVWTSQFSNQAWDLYCGQEQRFSFSFAASTRSHEVNELDERFEDARVSFKRTLRYWRWQLFDECTINSMPSLEECGIPRKFTIGTCSESPVSGRKAILTTTEALQDLKSSRERRNGQSTQKVVWARPSEKHH